MGKIYQQLSIEEHTMIQTRQCFVLNHVSIEPVFGQFALIQSITG